MRADSEGNRRLVEKRNAFTIGLRPAKEAVDERGLVTEAGTVSGKRMIFLGAPER
jgi:hypothetical protein